MIIVEVSLSPWPFQEPRGERKEEGKVGCLEKFVVAADAFSYVGMLRTGEGGRSPVSRTKNWIFFSLPSFIPRNLQSGCCCPAEQRQHANHRHRNKPLNLGAWPGGRAEDCSAVVCPVGRILGGTRAGGKGGRSKWPRAR